MELSAEPWQASNQRQSDQEAGRPDRLPSGSNADESDEDDPDKRKPNDAWERSSFEMCDEQLNPALVCVEHDWKDEEWFGRRAGNFNAMRDVAHAREVRNGRQ